MLSNYDYLEICVILVNEEAFDVLKCRLELTEQDNEDLVDHDFLILQSYDHVLLKVRVLDVRVHDNLVAFQAFD